MDTVTKVYLSSFFIHSLGRLAQHLFALKISSVNLIPKFCCRQIWLKFFKFCVISNLCSQERLFIHKTGSHAAAKNAIKAEKYITISMKGYNFAALTFSYL